MRNLFATIAAVSLTVGCEPADINVNPPDVIVTIPAATPNPTVNVDVVVNVPAGEPDPTAVVNVDVTVLPDPTANIVVNVAGNPQPTTAPVGFEIISDDGNLPWWEVTTVFVDGVPTRVIPAQIDPNVSHTITASAHEGYETPPPVELPIGSLVAGQAAYVRLVYKTTARERYAVAFDQFNHPVADAPLAWIHQDRTRTEGRGELCDIVRPGDVFVAGAVAGYSSVPERRIPFAEFPADGLIVQYDVPNGVEWTFETKTDTGVPVPPMVYVDGQSVENGVFVVDGTVPHTVIFGGAFGLTEPFAYHIAANAVPAGSRQHVVSVYQTRPYSELKKICGVDFPFGQAEVWRQDQPLQSLGWALGWGQLPCVWRPKNEETLLGFAHTEGDFLIERMATGYEGRELTVGVHHTNTQSVVCATANDPWGQVAQGATVWVGTEDFTQEWEHPNCLVTSAGELSIQVGQMGDFVVPNSISVTVEPGRLYVRYLQYQKLEYVPEPSPWYQGTVTAFGPPVDVVGRLQIAARYAVNGQEHGATSPTSSSGKPTFSLNRDDGIMRLAFQEIGGLSAPILEIDQAYPEANGVYNAVDNVWEWQVFYGESEPVGLACVDVRNQTNGIMSDLWQVEYDTHMAQASLFGAICSYLTVDAPSNHAIVAQWKQGYRVPTTVSIPPGMLQRGVVNSFGMVYLPWEMAQEVCIATRGAYAEIEVDGHSVGWNAVPGERTCIGLDWTRSHVIVGRPVAGCIGPNDLVVTPEDGQHVDVDLPYGPDGCGVR